MAPFAYGLFFVLVLGLAVQTGCGVKTEPVPYLRSYPEKAPTVEEPNQPAPPHTTPPPVKKAPKGKK